MGTETYKYFQPDASNLRSEYGGGAIQDGGDTAEVDPLTLTTRYICRELGFPKNGTHWLFQAGTDNSSNVWIRVSDNFYSAVSSFLSTSEAASVTSSAPTGFSTSSAQPSLMPRANKKSIISIGDSISVGVSGGGLDNAYVKLAVDDIETVVDADGGAVDREWMNDTWAALICGLGASSWGNTDSGGGAAVYPQRFDLAWNQRFRTLAISSNEEIFLHIWLGTNDLAYDTSLSGEDLMNRVATQMTNVRAEFPNTPLICGTLLRRSESSALNDRLEDYNDLLEAHYTLLGFDYIVKLHEANAVFDPATGDSTDATYYAGDGVHLTATGYDTIGAYFKTNALDIIEDGITTNSVTWSAPVNTAIPVISGTEQNGETLSCTTGTWTGAPAISYAYQWERSGSNIGGATSSTYLLTNDDVGETLTCVVTATNAANSTGVTAESAATGTIAQANTPPVNTVLPAITGTAQVGQELTCSTGTWSGFPVPAYAYQWEKEGVEISGATSSTYTPVEADEGDTLTCVVTATNSEGSASAESAATSAIAAAGYDPTDVSGCVLWLASDDAATITESSGAVSQWNDKSGNANHLTAPSTQEPTTGTRTVNSVNVIDFDPANNDVLSSTASGLQIFGNAAHTIVFMGVKDSATAVDAFIGGELTAGGVNAFIIYQNSTTWRYFSGGSVVNSTTDDEAPHVFTVRRTAGGDLDFYVDGVAVAATTTGAGSRSMDIFCLGSTNESGEFDLNGAIGDVFAWNVALTTAQMNAAGNALATKFGITYTNIT